ncbi:hypothetical protein DE149_1213 [Micrococcus sp. KT16]|uniref:hypothetical protein n=1 Tax=Micrococcus sp. KT16 TaxID=2184005 RepID=UPI000DEB093B|nr:hypothetical protein [Micrococcus sp. KT16]RBO83159.1 hypothetical protein DE149_1213 [Micrococcus sp. KT16]
MNEKDQRISQAAWNLAQILSTQEAARNLSPFLTDQQAQACIDLLRAHGMNAAASLLGVEHTLASRPATGPTVAVRDLNAGGEWTIGRVSRLW